MVPEKGLGHFRRRRAMGVCSARWRGPLWVPEAADQRLRLLLYKTSIMGLFLIFFFFSSRALRVLVGHPGQERVSEGTSLRARL